MLRRNLQVAASRRVTSRLQASAAASSMTMFISRNHNQHGNVNFNVTFSPILFSHHRHNHENVSTEEVEIVKDEIATVMCFSSSCACFLIFMFAWLLLCMLFSWIMTLDWKVSWQKDDIKELKEAVRGLERTTSKQNSDIRGLEWRVSGQKDDIKELKGDVRNLDSKVFKLELKRI